jgi:hypothetical protein
MEADGQRKEFDFKVFLHKEFIKEGIAAESYLNKVLSMVINLYRFPTNSNVQEFTWMKL